MALGLARIEQPENELQVPSTEHIVLPLGIVLNKPEDDVHLAVSAR